MFLFQMFHFEIELAEDRQVKNGFSEKDSDCRVEVQCLSPSDCWSKTSLPKCEDSYYYTVARVLYMVAKAWLKSFQGGCLFSLLTSPLGK